MKSFTLIEVIVAVGIFFILVGMAFTVMDAGISSWFAGDISASLRREIVKTAITMEKELKLTRASKTNLASGAAAATITFAVPQDNDNDGTILDSLAAIEWSNDADAVSPWTITYSLNANNEIIRATTAGGVSVVARNITSLRFNRPVSPVDILQVNISARKQNAEGRIFSDSGQLIIKMRN